MIVRTLIVGLLVLAALAVGAPALTGLYLAREFDQSVARLQRPGLLEVVSSRLTRGWFTSDATIRVALSGPLCAGPPCPSVTLTSRIHHGPIAFNAPIEPGHGLTPSLGVVETRLDLSTLWPRRVFEPELPPVGLITRVGFDGQARTALKMAGTRTEISRRQRQAHLDLDAVTGNIAQSMTGGVSSVDLKAPQLRLLAEQGAQFVWRDLTLDHAPATSATAAATRLNMAALTLADGMGSAGQIRDLRMRWQPMAADARPGSGLSGHAELHAESWVVDDLRGGPVAVQADLKHIDPMAVQSLGEALGNLYDARGLIVPEVRARLYRQWLPGVLANRAALDIQRLNVVTERGVIDAHMRIVAPETLRPVRLLADAVSQLNVDLAVSLPVAIARDLAVQVMLANGRSPYDIEETDIDRALGELVGQGLIERRPDETVYRLALTIEAGRLRLNGRNQIGWQSLVDQFETARARL
ncbi:DUF945 family protein [Salinisphaera sp. T31B1]|uniref:DUF945 family protein n=1 Tax=Salinisphaera sp. T31B1 TaxID=727963 RepID=UPI00334022C5